MRVFSAALVFLMLAAVPSSAAVLRGISGGTVDVDTGQGFQATSVAGALNPGDRVRTSQTSSVEIVYPNGCVQMIAPNQIATVTAPPACGASASQSGAAPIDATTLAVAGGVVVAGGAVAVIASQGGDSGSDKPASP